MTFYFWTKYGSSDHIAPMSRGHEPGQKSYLQSGTLKSGFSTPTFSRSNPDSNVFTCSIETQSIFKKKSFADRKPLSIPLPSTFFQQKLLKKYY